ncbi:excinuclease ABC subunit UvrB [Mycoplasma sp. Mirounga ES2805-ORL]|uniref:excinuclease ABC subunit UvrB n=1 Tax=Mycoplasma sp. Mirounga ES2805-ORL TaxID=754514 RepID=UPI00197CAAC6|nr:excinuclease ABC subunit UvrB [Mycoplasma sp. Mirounga ES2805-ORL]QSF13580.1 excinuclease ABC subunit UvrB [Mycoplasma sp. Mirounga ES2805-ORL]
MSIFKLKSSYKPSGDQPQAIDNIIRKIKEGEKYQVLKGVTGSGKTFTIANVIKEFDRPVLVLSHNKTLASQLYSELKSFFPENNVEYFVSYFDYYRPEAYLPSSDTYIDKTSKTNKDLDAMRLSAMNSVLTKKDTIIVASVSAIYGALSPEEYYASVLPIKVGMKIEQKDLLKKLVLRNYQRNEVNLDLGCFSSKGDVVWIRPADSDQYITRIDFFGDEIDSIKTVDPTTRNVIESHTNYTIFPGDAYTVNTDVITDACKKIYKELEARVKWFEKNNKLLEAQRIKERTEKDIDSLQEFGICPGIENYARYLDRREEGERPYTLLDYFKNKQPLLFIDESHMMIPQLNGMYNGDRSRKQSLVDYGFRLPSALDNRPLKFEEFENEFDFQTVFLSATPAEYELDKTHGVITRLFVRPTGLLDPTIEVRPSKNQVENIYDELQKQKAKNERTLILTTTKRMAEELTRYFLERNEKIAYIHSEHNTFERNEILRKLRKGVYDSVVGINLLREGIDLPEVSLMCVLDADKESFFRNTRSLIQIVGRAARNANGRVIFYGDSISKSMFETIQDNKTKRELQIQYNKEHNIIPKTIIKPISEPIQGDGMEGAIKFFFSNEKKEKNSQYNKEEIIKQLREKMNKAAKELDYEKAIELRDIILELQANNKK